MSTKFHHFIQKGQAYAELKASTTDVVSDVNTLGAQSTAGVIGNTPYFKDIMLFNNIESKYKTINLNLKLTADKVNRIQELEDEVEELGVSFGELSHQLAMARTEANTNLQALNGKIKELEDVKDDVQVENQMAQHKHKQARFYHLFTVSQDNYVTSYMQITNIICIILYIRKWIS